MGNDMLNFQAKVFRAYFSDDAGDIHTILLTAETDSGRLKQEDAIDILTQMNIEFKELIKVNVEYIDMSIPRNDFYAYTNE